MPTTRVLDIEGDPVLDRSTVVHQALGAASVCWERPEGAGVFDSDRAHMIALDVLDWLDADEHARLLDEPLLGYARTETLLEELEARLRVQNCNAGVELLQAARFLLTPDELDYRTVDS